jgi:hypothetical protein
MGVTLAHPQALLAALVGVVPLVIAFARTGTARRLRRELDLPQPSAGTLLARPAAIACLFGLLGLAAAQPSIHREHSRAARTDAEMVVVLDSSRSMLAAERRDSPPRYLRAATFARRLQAALPEVPAGISSLTNRLLPYLFPTSDARAFDLVLDKAYGVERPPPALTTDRWVTTFEPLNEVAVRRFFSPTVHKRILVILSDAETHDFESRTVLRHLRRAEATPIVVRFWHAGERIFPASRTDSSYHATQPGALAGLRATGWPAYDETSFAAVVHTIRSTIGTGPERRVGYDRRETSLASVVAVAALAPLLFLIIPTGRIPALTRRRRSTTAGTA